MAGAIILTAIIFGIVAIVTALSKGIFLEPAFKIGAGAIGTTLAIGFRLVITIDFISQFSPEASSAIANLLQIKDIVAAVCGVHGDVPRVIFVNRVFSTLFWSTSRSYFCRGERTRSTSKLTIYRWSLLTSSIYWV